MARTNTRAQRRTNQRILATSDVCHLCGHPGADAIDHITPWAVCEQRGIDPEAPGNKAPAHHDTPCPTCGHRCNREKGAKLIPPTMRRSAALTR